MTMKSHSKPPMRRVSEDQQGATVRLECGHIIDRRPGHKQPTRMHCTTCMPVDERLAYIAKLQKNDLEAKQTRRRNESPVQYYKRTKCVDARFTHRYRGFYYCNPAHCHSRWKSKAERDKHLDLAYAALS